MKGVTLATYAAYCKRRGQPAPGIPQLKAISDAEVEEIFRTDYWNRVRGDSLPAGVDYCAADFAFNSGAGQSVKELQRVVTALGYDTGGADGKIGSHTLSALDEAMKQEGENVVINAYMDKRWEFMQGLKNFSSFQNGWRTRIKDVRNNALNIARGDKTYTPYSIPGASAKAVPSQTKFAALPGGKSTLTTVGGAVATAAATGSSTLLSRTDGAAINLLPWLIGGFIVLTIVGHSLRLSC
jgi:lysozyme family protein